MTIMNLLASWWWLMTPLVAALTLHHFWKGLR